MEYRVKFLEGEYFWGGSVERGTDMPIHAGSNYRRDFSKGGSNQMMPLFLSNLGRYIWSEHPFKVWVEAGELCFEGSGFELVCAGSCLRDAYLAAMEAHFPFDDTRKRGKKLAREFFEVAQYNTWMEFTYDPTQEGVLAYAHAIIDHGFAPGILIIDEGWHTRYGLWEFDFHKFPDPKGMIDELHALGFTVMLWVTPLVTCDGQSFIRTYISPFATEESKNLFLRTSDGKIAIVEWWNGFSAILDMRKEGDRKYLDDKLQRLMRDFGVDGFKFDGGNYAMYHPENIRNGTAAPDHDAAALNIAWNEFGARYPFHEYKDTFKGGGKATIQRLLDRHHTWDRNGLNTIIPCAILQGLFGHPFICPDMIGGGEWTYNFIPGLVPDTELFVRMAQASALFPMMQFSWAPWRVLSGDRFAAVLAAAKLHREMAPELIRLVEMAEQTGEPILRCLEYNHPHEGYAEISDEFMLGRDLLVCPVITKGSLSRDVVFPAGRWQDAEGNRYDGGQTLRLDAPLHTLLWFRRIS
ncbi:MAG: glycoside hydrolase [Clostridia bacterium]|nr:glycoside hydrolase [Clostridia bacterium]